VKYKSKLKFDPAFATIEELAPMLLRREISPVELTKLFIARIEKHNAKLHAYLTVTPEEALRAARESEARFMRRKSRGPLDGIPISLKDNIWMRGIRTTAGSRVLEYFVPTVDATIVERLHRAGAVVLGKTNMHEFAYGITTENPHYGAAHNPWDISRTPGGSSGGSAAAIAAGLCVASIGTDTGGSVRIPASLCGITGLKPTFGRVSCFGVVPLAPSFDHVGPLARTSGDAALLLSVIAGRDPADISSLSQPRLKSIPNVRELGSRLKLRVSRKPIIRLGWPKEYFFDRLKDDVPRAVDAAMKTLVESGAVIEEISLPHVSEGDEPSTTIAMAEATHVHRRAGWFPAHAAEYAEDIRARLQTGGEIRAADYLAALEVRERVKQDFEKAFEKVDAIIAPTLPITAPQIGQKMAATSGGEETVRSALIRLNRPANFTGLPAISICCGWTADNLPIGLQIIGQEWREENLLAIARLFENARPELRRRPAQFS
jgi:aspartyl-tRNA(Asn)/glutamyl-tRNA(Gln) amidotransferase subunit A